MNLLFNILFCFFLINTTVFDLKNSTDCLQYNSGVEPESKIMYDIKNINIEDALLKIEYVKDEEDYQVTYLAGKIAKDILLTAKVGDILKYDYYKEKPVLVIIKKNETSIEVRYFYLCKSYS